jgi:hypothetical protein
MRVLLAASALLVGLSATAAYTAPIDENELVLRLRATSANCQGAATETQMRIQAEFARDLDFQTVQVASAVLTRFDDGTGGRIDQTMGGGYHIGDCSGTWRGDRSQWHRTSWMGNDDPCDDGNGSCYPTPARASRLQSLSGVELVPPGRTSNPYYRPPARFATFSKSYQDWTLNYVLLLPTTASRDDLRIGQKSSFRLAVTAVYGGTVYGVLQEIMPETAMLRCANGHEYAPSAGYKFCPIDGQPLK